MHDILSHVLSLNVVCYVTSYHITSSEINIDHTKIMTECIQITHTHKNTIKSINPLHDVPWDIRTHDKKSKNNGEKPSCKASALPAGTEPRMCLSSAPKSCFFPYEADGMQRDRWIPPKQVWKNTLVGDINSLKHGI